MSRPGWHQREYLPHYDGPDVIQHVVFRLSDSLPGSVMDAVARLASDEKKAHLDRYLDVGSGEAVLSNPIAAQIVVAAIKHFDGVRYWLHAWCVMPNHVHVILSPLGDHELGSILHSWKSFTAKKINALHNRAGPVWAADYFDRFMRDDEQLQATIEYVENNPVAAGLCVNRQDWRFSSAGERAGGTPALR